MNYSCALTDMDKVSLSRRGYASMVCGSVSVPARKCVCVCVCVCACVTFVLRVCAQLCVRLWCAMLA